MSSHHSAQAGYGHGFADGLNAGRLIERLRLASDRRDQAEGPAGLTEPEIVTQTGLTSNAVARALSHLERRGLATRVAQAPGVWVAV